VAQAKREKEWKKELAKLKKDQDELRRINQEKDDLIKRLQTASAQDRAAIEAKLKRIKERGQALQASISKRRRHGRRHAGSRASHTGARNGSMHVRTSDNPLDGL